MKRLTFLLIAVSAPFVFFSFLAKTDISNEDRISIFYEKELPNHSIIVRDLTQNIKNLGYQVSIGTFDSHQLNSFIISNPGALYITGKELSSELFKLKKHEYLMIKVAVTNPENEFSTVSGREFEELLENNRYTDAEIIRKIEKNRISIGIISFYNLNLQLKPLSIDGIFPSLHNIKSGEYGKVYGANIYSIAGNAILSNPGLHYNCGPWIKKTFSVIAGGDIMLARGTKRYMELHGAQYPFLHIRSEITKHDIAFANLESPISERGKKFYPDKGIYFRADPSAVEGLKYSGFDVFSLGNNHSLDWGIEAVYDTIEILRDNGFKFCGVGRTREEALKPAQVTINGTRIAFISLNGIYPFSVSEKKEDIMRTYSYNESYIAADITGLKKKYDILIASYHTGEEYLVQPEAQKMEKLRNLIDYGVDIVLSHHPHVIQSIETYNGGLIAYSLGNLIFDQNWSKETSMGLLLEISFAGEKPLYYRPQVVYINKTQPQIVENEESRKILSSLYMESKSYEYSKN